MNENTDIQIDAATVHKVMSHIGRKGGEVSTRAKAKAAMMNGLLGGRRSKAAVEEEEKAYDALLAAKKKGSPLEPFVRAWVKSCGKYKSVVKRKWKTAFGDIDDFLA